MKAVLVIGILHSSTTKIQLSEQTMKERWYSFVEKSVDLDSVIPQPVLTKSCPWMTLKEIL